MFGGIGTPEVIIILIVALLLFGAKRLPEIGRSIGRGIRELRKASEGVISDEDDKYKEEKGSGEKISNNDKGNNPE
ncbi:MAG: twin-arginine translocase TatA/TatE family subunit [bacterium]